MERYPVRAVEIVKFKAGERTEEDDLLAVEEPLEIRLKFGAGANRAEKRLAVTMRTVGHDFELATGFLFTEGLIQKASDIENIRYCEEPTSPEEVNNVVIVNLTESVEFDPKKLERHFYTTSSCGVCGKTSIDAVENVHCEILTDPNPKVSADYLLKLGEVLRNQQDVFKHTGGIHAAALFDESGKLLLTREDIGRHNAVDKLIGAMLHQSDFPLSDKVMWVSGRAGFELVQKAVSAGIPVMAAVGAPSSLAVDLARRYNLTLVGFLRDGRFNVYSGTERLA